MNLELHILQNFAPSNLNRDDTNAPKECEFGGQRRARISSQCLKRAIRQSFGSNDLVPAENRAVRTKRLVEMALIPRFVAAGKDPDEALRVAESVITGLGMSLDKKNPEQTQYLVFIGEAEIDRLVTVASQYWESLASTGKAEKKGKAAGELGKALGDVLDGGRACDLALFGRMLADIPQRNVDAASQVAHAISTHAVSTEFDFYTAVDDLRPDTTEGAGMMGTIEYNSACYYRYANVDLRQLLRNLGGDKELARATVRAWAQASIDAIPTGKQNSMAAHNPPSLIFAVLRGRGFQNLANAFVRPVNGRDGDLVNHSAEALNTYWDRVTSMYGRDGVVGTWLAAIDGQSLNHLAADGTMTVPQLIDAITAATSFAD